MAVVFSSFSFAIDDSDRSWSSSSTHLWFFAHLPVPAVLTAPTSWRLRLFLLLVGGLVGWVPREHTQVELQSDCLCGFRRIRFSAGKTGMLFCDDDYDILNLVRANLIAILTHTHPPLKPYDLQLQVCTPLFAPTQPSPPTDWCQF